jgi:hypothetical protein
MAINPVAVSGISPWEILGLHPGASPEEVSGAKRILAKLVHPDVLARGKAIFQIVEAAPEACLNGGRWPDGVNFQAIPPGSFTPSPPPPPRPSRPQNAGWFKTKKGGWSRRIGATSWINVYFAKDGSGWRFLGPDANGMTYFDTESHPTPEDAMAGADEYFRGM